MNCTDAQLDLQRRLDADGAEGARGFADLDAHLAVCPACARVWLDLLAVRQRLTGLRTDAPNPEEIDAMWQTIAATAPLELPAFRPPTRAVIFRFIGASAAVAACLLVAFILGEQRYGNSISPAASVGYKLRALATEGGTYAADDRAEKAVLAFSSTSDELAPLASAEAGTSEFGRFAGGFVIGDANGDSLPDAEGTGVADVAGRPVVTTLGKPTQAMDDGFFAAHDASRPSIQLGTEYYEYSQPEVDAGLPRTDALPRFAIESSAPPAGRLRHSVALVATGEDPKKAPLPALSTPQIEPATGDPTVWTMNFDKDLLANVPTPGESSEGQDTGRTVERLDPAESTENPSRPDRGYAGTQPAEDVALKVEGNRLVIAGVEQDVQAIEQLLSEIAQGDESAISPMLQPNEDRGVGSADGAKTPADVPQAAQATPARVKLIKTGALATEVDDYEQAVQQVTGILERFDCYLADASTKELAGGALAGEVVIRVSPTDFEALFAVLRAVGRLTSEDVRSADVTAQYVDLEARIAALKLTEARLVELVKSKTFVDRMDDLLKVEQEMNRVRTEIEQYEGQLRVLADRVALSTITLELREPARTVPAASLSVEVAELDKAADALADAVAGLDGRLVSGKVNERAQGALAGEYRLKVNLNRFGDTLTAIAALGRVDTREVRDWNAASADAPWAARVPCDIALTLFERARDLPGGSMTVQIGTLPDAIQQLTEAIDPLGASIAANRTTQRDDGSASADVQIRVPAGAFAQVVERVESLGRVIAKQLTGETGRILGGSADTPCTLTLTLSEPQRQIPSGGMIIEVEKFAPARDRLAKLVADRKIQVLASSSSQRTDGTWVGRFNLGITASAMDAAVSELEKLGEVAQREIRGIGLGELSRIDPNALGLIQVVLAEKAALTPEPDRAGGSFRKYLRDGLAGLYESLGLIVYGLVVLAPWLVIALGAGSLVTRVWKRRRARATEPRL